MPKRLICPAVGQVAWQDYEDRAPGADEVRVRCEFGVEKHGTMMAFYKGYANERGRWDADARVHRPEGVLWNYPLPLGNMQVGTVTDAGAESGLSVGQQVYFSGAFQPTATLKGSSCRVLRPGVSWQSAMLMDPAEFAVGAARDGKVRVGDDVAVFGLGAIGLVTVQVLRAAGAARIFALDPLPARRDAALRCGADEVIDPTAGDAGMALRERTGMRGMDVVVDFSGSRHALQAALRGVGYLGTIVCGAFPPPFDAGLDFGGEAHMNRPNIVFSRACSDPNPDHPRWDWARIQDVVVGMIDRGQLRGEPIIDEPVPFDDLLEQYPKIATDPSATIKLSVKYL